MFGLARKEPPGAFATATEPQRTRPDAFRQMVDDIPVNVMTLNLDDFTIDYANRKSIETLRTLEHLLPCRADELVGQCVDIFHKNPSHQRKLLADPKNLPYQTNITLGEEILDLLVTPIYDDSGTYTAPMLTWNVVTEKVKLDREAKQLKTMVDNMPINVMMCDPVEFRINYINRTSVQTLRAIEDLLPCKADEVLGQCVDIFHKHPEHQRRILGDPRNLPHNAKIKLGDETLDLRVAPITDDSGVYLGPMVSWSVVTRQVKLADDFESNVKSVVETVTAASSEMQSSAAALSNTADETNQRAVTVASASEEATTNVQTVAASAEELSKSIQEISSQVTQGTGIARTAVEEAHRANERVQGLAEAAQKIGEVISLINDIASQTNLLAHNATIEAARAGEAGKGFAVVATEVKSLADQTAKATDEISEQINAIQSATNEAVKAIEGIGSTITEISEITTAIASAVEEQGAATNEIAGSVQQAADGTREVSTHIAGVTQAAGETGNASQQVLKAAEELSQQAEMLRTQVDAFLTDVRAM